MSQFLNFFNALKGSYSLIIDGLKSTLLIAIFGLIIGVIFGSILAIFKILPQKSVIKVFSCFSDIYVAIFRGIPIVVQLLIVHFVILSKVTVIPTFDIPINFIPNVDEFRIVIFDKILFEAILVFGLNSSAYVCEIMRGGILSVDPGQTEAGRALGLNYAQTMWRIVLPQAVKNVVPTLGNEFIALLKETSIVGYVAGVDITKALANIANSNYAYIPGYLALALVYLVLVLIATGIVKLIERRLRAGDKR